MEVYRKFGEMLNANGVPAPTYIFSIASYVIILTYGTKERFTK
jgi:hypothetical protein